MTKRHLLNLIFQKLKWILKNLKIQKKLDKKIIDINVLDPELVEVDDQVSINFEKPLPNRTLNKNKIIYELTEDVNDIIVKDPIEIIPVSEVDGMKLKNLVLIVLRKKIKKHKILQIKKTTNQSTTIVQLRGTI